MSEEKKGTYNFEGRAFFSLKSGKQVAHLDDGNAVIFEPGCAGPHTRQLADWLRENGLQFANLPAPVSSAPPAPPVPPVLPKTEIPKEKAVTLAGAADDASGNSDEAEKTPPSPAKLVIEDIPAELLPPFDPMLGTSTPGFGDYVRRHKLNKDQVGALLRRLERK